MTDFFVSYTESDRPWAKWIAWQLENASYKTILDVWDFRPGSNFLLAMQEAASEARCTLAVLSPAYLKALYTQSEWAAAFADDPTGTKRRLIPVRIEECELPGLLKSIVFIDLVGKSEEQAREALLSGVAPGRPKPKTAPRWPGEGPAAPIYPPKQIDRSLVDREVDRPPTESERAMEPLLDRIAADKFVPILGPGLYRDLLPSSAEIAAQWADEHDYSLAGRTDLPSVAQFVATQVDESFVHEKLQETLIQYLLDQEHFFDPSERQEIEESGRLRERGGLTRVIGHLAARYFKDHPNDPHRILAGLPISTYITTNYDSFLTAALERKIAKSPQRWSCLWRPDLEDQTTLKQYADLGSNPKEPLVFHLYGNDLDPELQVLTEDNYLDFLVAVAQNESSIPDHIRKALTQSELLFLGFDLCDLGCRVLFRALVNQLRLGVRKRRVIFQLRQNQRKEPLRKFLKGTCEALHIQLFWGSEREFLIKLRDRWAQREHR